MLCHKKGHFAAACCTSKMDCVSQAECESCSEDFVFLGELATPTVQEWTETVTFNGTAIQFKLDTGAAVSAVPECFQQKRPWSPQKS